MQKFKRKFKKFLIQKFYYKVEEFLEDKKKQTLFMNFKLKVSLCLYDDVIIFKEINLYLFIYSFILCNVTISTNSTNLNNINIVLLYNFLYCF